MSNEIDLLQRAGADLGTAKLILESDLPDPLYLDIAAYHLQQALEKIMKHIININGKKFPFVHEIDVLYNTMETYGLDPPAWIAEHEDTLTKYATVTRYTRNIVASRRKLTELLPLVEDYLEQHRNPAS